MSQEPARLGFSLSQMQLQKINKWALQQDKKVAEQQGQSYPNYGAIGGGYTYKFTPTSMGIIVKVENSITKEELDISENL
jgi:hypothetical protein